MAKSQQTFNKKEREKKKQKKRKEKLERRQERKAEKAERGKLSFEEQLSYVDEFGNITDTPPDPTKRSTIKAEDIKLGVPDNSKDPIETVRQGVVKFFNSEKGYGFINDAGNGDSVFVHINNIEGEIKEGNRVTFETEKGPKGPMAVRVKIAD